MNTKHFPGRCRVEFGANSHGYIRIEIVPERRSGGVTKGLFMLIDLPVPLYARVAVLGARVWG